MNSETPIYEYCMICGCTELSKAVRICGGWEFHCAGCNSVIDHDFDDDVEVYDAFEEFY